MRRSGSTRVPRPIPPLRDLEDPTAEQDRVEAVAGRCRHELAGDLGVEGAHPGGLQALRVRASRREHLLERGRLQELLLGLSGVLDLREDLRLDKGDLLNGLLGRGDAAVGLPVQPLLGEGPRLGIEVQGADQERAHRQAEDPEASRRPCGPPLRG